jgi:glucosamine kinase
MANISTDRQAALRNILAATGDALESLSAPPPMSEIHAAAGLAGANVGDHAEWIAARLPFAHTLVVPDTHIALEGAHGGEDGIVAIVGTGSAFAARRGGTVTTAGGWGIAVGDEASGAALGQAAIRAALHMADGLAPRSPLLDALLTQAGSPEALSAQSVHAAPADFARLAPAVIDAADRGDATAEAILSEADTYIARVIDHMMTDGPLPIAFHGGLSEVYARRLTPRYGDLIRPAKSSALDGALALARKTTAGSPAP